MRPKNKTAVSQERGGFTLVELLVVVIILAIIAGLSFPVISSQIEKSRGGEAVEHLEAVKDGLLKYYSLNKTYVGASFLNMDYDPNQAQAGQKVLFTYTLDTLTGIGYTIKALRRTGVAGVPDASGVASDNWITLDQNGSVVKNGVYT